MASNDIQFSILAQFPTLQALNKELATAKLALSKVAVTINGEVNPAFAKQEQYVAAVNGTIKNYNSLSAIQAAEMEKVWASLDRLNKKGEQAAVVDIKKGQAIDQNIAAMVRLSQVQTGTLNPALGRTTKTSANAGMALLNLNYVIRDSPYFFNNFAMGVLAVGNNINPLIDSFSRVRAEAKQLTKDTGQLTTTFGMLKKSMIGGAGISIAFSVIVTVIQAFVFQMARAKRETKEAAKETENLEEKLTLVKGTLEDIIKVQKDFRKEQMTVVRDYETEIAAIQRMIDKGGVKSGGQFFPWTGEQIQGFGGTIAKLREEQENYNKTLSGGSGISAGTIELMKGLGVAALKGKDAIQAFAKENKLSQSQLDNIIGLWRTYGKEVAAVGGGLAGELPEGMREVALQLGIQDKELQIILKAFEKIKESAKKTRDYLRDQAQALVRIASIGQGLPAGVRPSNIIGIPFAEPDRGGNEMAGGKRMKDNMKEFNIQLETGKIFANLLGDALNEAFMKGNIALKDFIQSLMSAIAQMLILRAITAFLTGGAGNAASAVIATPAGIPKAGGLNKGSVRVTGEITADKNNFIAKIRNADNYYKRNEEFVVIGR